MNSLYKKPSAWLPIAIPLAFVLIMLIRLPFYGIPAPEQDEGTLAHLFQVWLVAEPFLLANFAFRYFLEQPKQASIVLVLQIAAALCIVAPVFLLGL